MDVKKSPRYEGPCSLINAKSRLSHSEYCESAFTRDGARADVEYRDLGLSEATGGRIGARHIRAIGPFPRETGWHWHDMTTHYVYVLRGSLTFRFAGVEGEVVLHAGDGLSQPAGDVGEGLPLHQLHRQVEHPVRLAHLVDVDDVRVREGARGARLVEEHFPEVRRLRILRANHLQRDGPGDASGERLVRPVHLGHPALGDLPHHAEAFKLGSRFERHGWG